MPEKAADEHFVTTPYIGEGYFIDEMGEIAEFLVKEGDHVKVDQTVATIETVKAAIDVRRGVRQGRPCIAALTRPRRSARRSRGSSASSSSRRATRSGRYDSDAPP
jgi:multidrug efflux pump subunit AcrA (membrane-fusion protein)